MESTQKAAQRRQESLETELNGYKTNLIKESIRLGHNELGNHHYACGRLQVSPSVSDDIISRNLQAFTTVSLLSEIQEAACGPGPATADT